jgi:hypothetical protein
VTGDTRGCGHSQASLPLARRHPVPGSTRLRPEPFSPGNASGHFVSSYSLDTGVA